MELTFGAHAELIGAVTTLRRKVQNDLNADLFLIFNEKKYKEVYAFARKTEKRQIQKWDDIATSFVRTVEAVAAASATRQNIEFAPKQANSALEQVSPAVAYLQNSLSSELKTRFEAFQQQEAAMKGPEPKEEEKEKKKKKAPK